MKEKFYLNNLEELKLYLKELISLQLEYAEEDNNIYIFLKNKKFQINIENIKN